MAGLWNPIKLVTKNAAKLGIAGGSVYLTVEQGIWGNARQGEIAYHKLKAMDLPETADLTAGLPSLPELPVQLPEISLPSVPAEVTTAVKTVSSKIESGLESASDFRQNLPHYWNAGIKASCSGFLGIVDTSPEECLHTVVDKVKQIGN